MASSSWRASGMERVLAGYFGFSSAEVTRYLDHNDHAHDDGRIVRIVVFAVRRAP
ncbi:hypothetical protein [Streptomyces afghaniensis]|uniref:hypothetical protein n=1 Tax=Streptomyces afghaniensis TaxID=66865 RepID=UPI0027844781|nr:hypothetical protein [Streptomyces afghaniensis]MDQ1022251.1 hypothetical protein [Streptomyces afghaniensis]